MRILLGLACAALLACRAPGTSPVAAQIAVDASASDASSSLGGERVDTASGECAIVGVASDGAIELRVGGRSVTARLNGVDILPAAKSNVMDVVRRGRRAPRCSLLPSDGGARLVKVEVFGWQDKSGDVWQDFAALLLDMGLATVAPGDLLERAEYLRLERAARDAGRGPWK